MQHTDHLTNLSKTIYEWVQLMLPLIKYRNYNTVQIRGLFCIHTHDKLSNHKLSQQVNI